MQLTIIRVLSLLLLMLLVVQGFSQALQKGNLIYCNALATEADVANWVMEGAGVVEFKDSCMHMFSPNEDGHHVFWCPTNFPENFIAEWDVQNIEPDAGLCIVFFAATGKLGKNLFDSALRPRNGAFKGYTKGDINNYHISYYANGSNQPGRETANLRKNAGFHKVQSAAAGIPINSTAVHHIQLIKQGGKIMLRIDDRVVIDWTDDGNKYGPVLGAGKIGFRQMKWTHFTYSNFNVWETAE